MKTATTHMVSVANALLQASRTLSRAPGFASTIVVTLALAIGANTAVFSALDAVLFEPLPFPDAGRLVRVSQTMRGNTVDNVGPARLEDWNERSATFYALTGYYTEDVSDTSGDYPERLRRANVAPRFFDVWGIAPALGRGFNEADHEPGAAPIVVISARYWQRRFASDPRVIDSSIRIGDNSYRLVGVMPADFAFPDRDVDLWVPTVNYPFVLERRNAWYAGFGRLEPGVTIEQARADLDRVQSQLAREFADTDRDIGAAIEPLKETAVGAVRASLWLLFGAVTVLLLIACTNIAALLLARASQRRQDMAVRLALGSSRVSLAMQTLAEAGVLVVLGSVVGIAVAASATSAFRRLAPELPRVDEIVIDGSTLAYTLASVLVVTLLCGLVPAFRTARRAERGALAGGTRGQVSSRHSLQWVLVGVQVALSVMLLAGAGLLVRSFQALSQVDTGFEPRGVLTFRISGSYAEPADGMRQMVEHVLRELEASPGISGAATSTPVPGVLNDRSGFDVGNTVWRISGGDDDPADAMPSEVRFVSPSYFDVMRIPLLAGEPCRQRRADAVPDLVVNESFAARYFAGRPPLGQVVESRGGNVGRIVGIYGDAREFGADSSPVPTAYGCLSAVAYPPLAFVVRTEGDPEAAIDTIRQRVKALEPARSLYDFMTLEERMGAEYAADRLRAVLIALFATAALALVCLGIYGTLSYVVSLRRREVGLRMALGARRENIVGQFVSRTMRIVGAAVATGLMASLIFSRALSGMLFEISPTDPFVLGAVIVTVMLVATSAALVPALRASRTNPMIALRQD